MKNTGFLNYIDCAVLKVLVPLDTSLTISNGRITKTFDKDYAIKDNNGYIIYILYFQQTDFGMWTISILENNNVREKTILINDFVIYVQTLLIPNEYQQIEYIQSSGTQWIDTGITPNSDTVAQIKFMNLAVTADLIFGYSIGSDTTDWRLFNSSSIYYFDIPGGSGAGNRIQGGSCPINTIQEIELGNFYIKDLKINSNIVSTSPISYTGVSSITLNYRSSSSISQNRWYYVKIYESNNIICDLIPCIRKTDSVAGLWDTISQTFLTNAGTGEFTVGSSIDKIEQPLSIFQSGLGSLIPVTYGHESNSSISVTKNNIITNYTSTSSYQITYFNTNPIDLSQYSKLIVVSSIDTRASSDANYAGIIFAANGLPPSNGGGTHTNAHVIAQTPIASGGINQVSILNLDDININGYVGLRGGMKGTISNIYLI